MNISRSQKKKIALASRWLSLSQNSDGSFPLITEMPQGKKYFFDPLRSVLAGWALAEFGKISKNNHLVSLARRNFDFHKDIFQEKYAENHQAPILCFLGQLSTSLNDFQTSEKCAKIILENNLQKTNTTNQKLSASFLLSFSQKYNRFSGEALEMAEKSRKKFILERKSLPNPQYGLCSDLINFYSQYPNINNEQKTFLNGLVEWFLKNQSLEGFYKMSSRDTEPNTRKTGKTLENLASALNSKNLDPKLKKSAEKSFQRGLDWILSLQYRNKLVYFLRKKSTRQSFLGGIRQTPSDSNIWIDSVSHLLIAISRITK